MTHSTTLPVKNLPPPSAPFRVSAVHLVVALLSCLGYFCFSIWHRFTNSVLYQEFAVNFSTFYVLLPSAFGYLYYFAASNNISNYKPLLRQTAIISSSLLFIWIIASALSAWVLVIQYDCVEDEVSEKGISLINYKKNFQCSLASSLIALFNTIIRIPVIAVWVYMAKKSIRKGKREEEKSRDLNTAQVKVASAQQLVCQEQSSASIIPSNTATLQASSSGNILTTDNPRTYVGYASIVFVVFGNSVFAAVDRLLNPQTAMINTLTALVNIGVIPIFVAIDRRKKFNFSFQYFIGFMATLNFLRGMTQAISSFQTIQGFPKHVLLPLISVQILLFVTCYTIIFSIISTRMTSEKHYRPFFILVQMIKWTITTNAVGLFSDVAGAGVLVLQICLELFSFWVRNLEWESICLRFLEMIKGFGKKPNQKLSSKDVGVSKQNLPSRYWFNLNFELLIQDYVVQMFARFAMILRVSADISIATDFRRPKLLCTTDYKYYFYHLSYELISIIVMTIFCLGLIERRYRRVTVETGLKLVWSKVDTVMLLAFVTSFAYVLEGSFQLRCL